MGIELQFVVLLPAFQIIVLLYSIVFIHDIISTISSTLHIDMLDCDVIFL